MESLREDILGSFGKWGVSSGGGNKRSRRRVRSLDKPLRAINHVHVSVAAGQLIQHLSQPLFLSCFLFCARDPADVIVLVVRRAIAIRLYESMLKKRLPDKGRHFVARSF